MALYLLVKLQRTNLVLQENRTRWFGAQKVFVVAMGLVRGGGAVRDVVALEKMQQMNFAPGHAR